MLDNRLKDLRKERLMTLDDLAKQVGKAASTISRYENNLVDRLDLDLIEKIADVLNTSSDYLLGRNEDRDYICEFKTAKYFEHDVLKTVFVTDDKMAPQIPEDSYVKIRDLKPNEKLSAGGFYYVEFNNERCFRMAVADPVEGVNLMPVDMSEQRIAYDKEYVKFIGKAVATINILEDVQKY